MTRRLHGRRLVFCTCLKSACVLYVGCQRTWTARRRLIPAFNSFKAVLRSYNPLKSGRTHSDKPLEWVAFRGLSIRIVADSDKPLCIRGGRSLPRFLLDLLGPPRNSRILISQSMPSSTQTIIIEPSKGWSSLRLGELWHYRELIGVLAYRDIRSRYKQSVLGVAWAVIQPLTTMIIFSVLFGLLLGSTRKPTMDGVPYAISTFCALVVWQLFARALTASGNSLVANQHLITKVYFPRLVAPLAPILASLVDFLLAFFVLFLMIIGFYIWSDAYPLQGKDGPFDYDIRLQWQLLTIPLFTLFAVMAALSISLWLSALNAIWRDVRHMLGFIVQIWMLTTPVVYTTQSVMENQEPWARVLYGLNPMACVVEGFRWAILGGEEPQWLVLSCSVSIVVVVLIGGLYFFRRMESSIVDLV
jgi:lipopolysaccharide transport system permease protein